MRVKIFLGQDGEKLEVEINGWLINHRANKIQYITQSQDAGTESYMCVIVICIWYK